MPQGFVRIVEVFKDVRHENNVEPTMEFRPNFRQVTFHVGEPDARQNSTEFRGGFDAENLTTSFASPPQKQALAWPDLKETGTAERPQLLQPPKLLLQMLRLNHQPSTQRWRGN